MLKIQHSSATSGKSDWRMRRAAVRVEAHGQQVQGHVAGQLAELLAVMDGGEGVVVDDGVDRVVLVLQGDVIALRAGSCRRWLAPLGWMPKHPFPAKQGVRRRLAAPHRSSSGRVYGPDFRRLVESPLPAGPPVSDLRYQAPTPTPSGRRDPSRPSGRTRWSTPRSDRRTTARGRRWLSLRQRRNGRGRRSPAPAGRGRMGRTALPGGGEPPRERRAAARSPGRAGEVAGAAAPSPCGRPRAPWIGFEHSLAIR